MAAPAEVQNMALFCDFENVALGVVDARLPPFEIRRVLDRLLLKGDIVVKKAYCDWKRYEGFKAAMHEAAFELIEIPHVRQSGKNSADIRMVVDALDLCYTKAHVDCFVIISGDSDFSPLVSKLRENNKTVIGVGVRGSTSSLLRDNCDEFVFYDDLVQDEQKKQRRRGQQPAAAKPAPQKSSPRGKEAPAAADGEQNLDARRLEAIQLVVDTVEEMISVRGGDEKLVPSAIKNTLTRRQPGFNESAYGFSAFGKLLEAAHQRGLLVVERDEKTRNYIVRPVQH